MKHVYQPVLRVIRWAVNGGFADMFLRSSSRYAISVLRHQMQLHLVHSLQLLSQLLPLLLRAQKQTALNQSVVPRMRCHNSLSQGLTVSQRSPVTLCSLTAFTGRFTTRQDGGQNSVPNLRSLGSSPCYSGLCRMVRPRCQASSDPGLT